ncbi:hypothetical protein LPJ56_005179, partial [Coemansia sp. RSA 2599]
MDDFAGLSWTSSGSQGGQRSNGNAANQQSSSALRTAAAAASRPNYSPSISSASGLGQNSSAGSGATGRQAPKDDPFGEL